MIQPTNAPNPYNQPRCEGPAPIVYNTDYNAIKISINGASVNAPAPNAHTEHGPHGKHRTKNEERIQENMPSYYDYPQANLYDYPKAEQQAYYAPAEKPPINYVPAAEDVAKSYCTCPTCGTTLPSQAIASDGIQAEVPQPQVVAQNPFSTPAIQPQITQQNINYAVANAPAPVITEAAKANNEEDTIDIKDNAAEEVPAEETPDSEISAEEIAQEAPKVEIKKPEELKPQIDINAFIAELANPDFDKQAITMEAIALMVKQDPEKATELLDEGVINALKGIITADTKELLGPTKEQTDARMKIMQGKEVSDIEKELANTITPLEQAERNKSYALFSMAILEKLFNNEVEKLSGQIVPFKDIPGIITVVEQMSSNPNPTVRASAVEALYYVQRPEYKDDLNALLQIALNDPDRKVRQTAKAAYDSLNQA